MTATVYDEQCERVAVARGLFFNRRIVVGPAFYDLPKRQQDAVLAHEEAHCRGWHLELRLLLLPLFWTRWARRLAARQELTADDFAVEQGYGVELLEFLRHDDGGEYYPDPLLRRLHLLRRIKEHHHAAVAA